MVTNGARVSLVVRSGQTGRPVGSGAVGSSSPRATSKWAAMNYSSSALSKTTTLTAGSASSLSTRSRSATIISGSMRLRGGLSKVTRQWESEGLLTARGDEFVMMIFAVW
jgi:hypothetical protein